MSFLFKKLSVLIQKRKKNLDEIQYHRAMTAFTLVEIMIVVGLITMFTAMGFGISRQTNTQTSFFRDQAKVIHAIYQAREYAMAIRGNECGYGIRVAEGMLDIIKVSPDGGGACPDTLNTVAIEETISTTLTIEGNFTLVFMAPFGKQILDGKSACFIITDSSGKYSSVIKINSSGTPYVDNAAHVCN